MKKLFFLLCFISLSNNLSSFHFSLKLRDSLDYSFKKNSDELLCMGNCYAGWTPDAGLLVLQSNGTVLLYKFCKEEKQDSLQLIELQKLNMDGDVYVMDYRDPHNGAAVDIRVVEKGGCSNVVSSFHSPNLLEQLNGKNLNNDNDKYLFSALPNSLRHKQISFLHLSEFNDQYAVIQTLEDVCFLYNGKISFFSLQNNHVQIPLIDKVVWHKYKPCGVLFSEEAKMAIVFNNSTGDCLFLALHNGKKTAYPTACAWHPVHQNILLVGFSDGTLAAYTVAFSRKSKHMPEFNKKKNKQDKTLYYSLLPEYVVKIHTGPINEIQFNPFDCSIIATASKSNVSVWEISFPCDVHRKKLQSFSHGNGHIVFNDVICELYSENYIQNT